MGALIDPDVERILSLRPDLVVVYASQADLREQMRRAGIQTWPFAHAGLADVARVTTEIGALTGHAREGDALAASITAQITRVRASAADGTRPKVLLVFGREPLALRNIYASGGVGFLHDLIEVAGGANVFADVRRESVQATTELILARAPDVIIELRPEGLSIGSRETGRARRVVDARRQCPPCETGACISCPAASSSCRDRASGRRPKRSRRRSGRDAETCGGGRQATGSGRLATVQRSTATVDGRRGYSANSIVTLGVSPISPASVSRRRTASRPRSP